ncbi:MAG: terpene cyclase/mutase family protein [bacterium]|nr:terpene cyclase/mutase family protein [bacterium]
MQRSIRNATSALAAGFLLVPAILVMPLPAQSGDGAPKRKTGTICKQQVDGLIRLVRGQAAGGALGGSSVATTAKLVTAMGHCHRRYHRGDGPVVRPSIDFLIRSRRADGSFGDAMATTWAVAALGVMDKKAFPEEIAQARAWLAQKAGEVSATPFADRIEAVMQQVRADVFPQHVAKAAAARADGWLQAGSAKPAEIADTLLELVACQTANRWLDRAEKPIQGKAAVFTPAQQKAFDWLMTQHKDGVYHASFAGKTFPDPGLTGFLLLALQTKPAAMRTAAEQKVIDQGVAWLRQQQNEDGTFGTQVPNYTTCVSVAALARHSDPTLAPQLSKAQKAILAFQNIEASGYRESDRDYGSIGYGNSQRGDLSNLHFSLEALKATGLPENHEAFAKAIVFLQRTQNLKSVNDFEGRVPDPEKEGEMIDATPGDDGGAVYYPGSSNAGYLVQPDGKAIPRSYGSMTYALLKAYILAGLPGDDKRVKAAVGWIQQNWDLATNPGADPALGEKVKYQGLFYYYMVLAQALDLSGTEHVEVTEGGPAATAAKKIAWRPALKQQLEGMQDPKGFWINGKNGRWMESLDLLCTCYAMVALERCN